MKKVFIIIFGLITLTAFSQSEAKAIKLLDEVSAKVASYENISLTFDYILDNEAENIHQETNGKVNLKGDKYHLSLMGSEWIYDTKATYVVNHEDMEVVITKGTGDEESEFIPSKMLSFYKTGYTYKWGKLKDLKGKKIQFITLTPINTNDENKTISLGIDVKNKNINQVIYKKKSGISITLRIRSYKTNVSLPANEFTFDEALYEKKDYIIERL